MSAPARYIQPSWQQSNNGTAQEFNTLDTPTLMFLTQPCGNSSKFNEVLLLFKNHISEEISRNLAAVFSEYLVTPTQV